MCCLFTYLGYMLDFIQRCLTFGMTFLICCSIVLLLGVASVAGVALGYNYSLSEFIELKETNVSVYLKRGVFDDELGDDVSARRSLHLPLNEHLKDDNLRTGAPEGADPSEVLDGRRSIDNSIVESLDHNRYESALIRMSLTPPSETAATTPELVVEPPADYSEVHAMDKLKAIQSLVNMRKSGDRYTRKGTVTVKSIPGGHQTDSDLSHLNEDVPPPLRRAMDSPVVVQNRLSPYRLAVPGTIVKEDWAWPKEWAQMHKDVRDNLRDSFGRPIISPTYPPPITPLLRRPRPSVVQEKPKVPLPTRLMLPSPPSPGPGRTEAPELSGDEGPDKFQEKFRLTLPTLSAREIEMRTMFPLKMEEYEEEPIIPVRKRRHRRQTAAVTTPTTGISRSNHTDHIEDGAGKKLKGNSTKSVSVVSPSSGTSRKIYTDHIDSGDGKNLKGSSTKSVFVSVGSS